LERVKDARNRFKPQERQGKGSQESGLTPERAREGFRFPLLAPKGKGIGRCPFLLE
jgi:hypothetical protein